MLDKEAWRTSIIIIVEENTFSNSGRCRTRSAIVQLLLFSII
jgi:hypothetical protein